MVKLGLALLSGLLIGPSAMACIAMPENITLQGSTFADALEMSLLTQCKVSLIFTSQSQEKAQTELWDKRDQEFKAWKQKNFGVTYTSINAYDIENEQHKIIREKYPDVPAPARNTLVVEGGKPCLRIADSKECKSEGSVLIKEAGKPVTLLEVKDQLAFVFSVDAQGEKDMRKPYLKIKPQGANGAFFEAIENGTTIGKMDVAGEDCSQGMSRGLGIGGGAGGSGNLELRGKEYVSEGSGCSGGFVGKDLTQPKGQLLRNGQKVSK